ncbi:MAG: C40 family peptidase [Candidatus Marinimicrobia bacterium]|nr:C40 family peptidase [Candidatus Neomarinimicrobiota bacterium]
MVNKYFNPNTAVVPVYNKPEFSSGKITEIILGESCEIIGTEKNWFQVVQDDGYKGWVNSFFGYVSDKFISTSHLYIGQTISFDWDGQKQFIPFGARIDQNNPIFNDHSWGNSIVPLKQNHVIENVIPLAKTLLGVPYRWGGKTSFGFDCSGLIQTVCRACGIQLPRDAWQQQEALSEYQIEASDALPGDIHFFGEKDKVTHVGFSLNGKKILHAQGWVKEESFNDNESNYNQSLVDKYLSSYSIRRNFRP